MIILLDLIIIALTLALLIVINTQVSARVSIWVGPLIIVFLTIVSWKLNNDFSLFNAIYFICIVVGFVFTWLGRPLNK